MQVLITGGTGFIGSRLALRCLELGYPVRVLGLENTPAEAENRRLVEANGAEVILASVTDRPDLERALSGVNLVFHLAAAQHEAGAPDQLFWDVNVEGTRTLLGTCQKSGVSRLVHGSTIGVYGQTLEGVITESSPQEPDNIYGKTKLEAEKLVEGFRGKLPVAVVRISETYGPGDRRLLKLFRGIKNGLFFMIGPGLNQHHLIYIDDLIAGLMLAAQSDTAVGQTFVLAGKEPVTTNEMVAFIATAVGARPPRWRAPLPLFLALAGLMERLLPPLGIRPPLHRRRMDFFRKSFVFSNNHAEKVLGYSPEVGFQEGAAATALWYTEQGLL